MTLTSKAIELISRWKNMSRKKVPSWEYFFMKMAYDVSLRSPDSQTQNGAIITDSTHHILSTGYNGFMQGIDDSVLPTERPDKYPWMLHSELNAILHCQNRETAHTIYVTGRPCLHCFQCIVQYGIKNLVYNTNNKAHMISNEEQDTLFEIAVELTKNKINIKEVDYDFWNKDG